MIQQGLRAAIKRAIKLTGRTQKDFAQLIGLSPAYFGMKLKQSDFTAPEIKLIIIYLASDYGVNKKEDVYSILELAGVRPAIFSQTEWQKFPLSELT